jgi:hypothetical protein
LFVFVIVGTLPLSNALLSVGHVARAHVGALPLHDPVAAPVESCAHVRVAPLERK